MMRAMGFCPSKNMTPLQFLIAVFNDETALIYRDEKKRKKTDDRGGIGLSYRLEAAKTAARYMHMEMPKIQINTDEGNFGESLTRAAQQGNERVRTRTVIMETIERISPDVPLADASYPPIYGQHDAVVIDEKGMVEGEMELNPEGDKDYNPDAD